MAYTDAQIRNLRNNERWAGRQSGMDTALKLIRAKAAGETPRCVGVKAKEIWVALNALQRGRTRLVAVDSKKIA